MATTPARQRLNDLLNKHELVIAPGVFDGISAQLTKRTGHAAAYMTGAGVAASGFGLPDIGLVTASEMAERARVIVGTLGDIPLIADADTGYGAPMNVVRTVRAYDAAGVAAIQLEDQVFPKRCGHFDGKTVVPQAEMVAKIKAAVDARSDPDLLIVARTDAIATHGFQAAIERAGAYREAGADVGFVEAPQSLAEIADIPRLLPWPQLINIVLGGRTPELPNEKLRELGFAGVLYANVALQSALRGMQAALSVLRKDGRMGDASVLAVDFAERQRLVGKPEFDALERKYQAD